MRTPPTLPAATVHPAPAVPDTGRAVRRWWRAAWIWFVLAALLVLVALPSILRQDPGARPLGTDSARPEGGRAVARVLAQHGIAVHPAASLPEALALAAEHPGAPVLFHDPAGHLPAEGLGQFAEGVGPGRRVLVEPGLPVLQALAPGVSQGGVVPEGAPLPAGQQCHWPAAVEARSVSAGGRSYRTGPSGQECFPVPGTDAGPSGAAHAVVTTAEGTVVLGHRDMVANAGAADEGHAVLSLWTLGRGTDVIWYLPSLADVPVDGGTPTLDRLLPDWVRPAGLWLGVCLLVLLLWRGRRHGPLAVEPLPVIVPASETAVGRARLYEHSGQYPAAARTLRSATLVRLASALRLGPSAPVGAVVTAASRASGLDAGRVGSALDVDDVGSGRDLVAAAAALQDLEDEVHRGLQATGTAPDKTPTATDTAADTPSDTDLRTP
ncbi:MAG: hypothetical protein MOP51_2267 [Citricoccus sp.]|nr:hypothetical protein [Citricoccus sp. WCRC_4]